MILDEIVAAKRAENLRRAPIDRARLSTAPTVRPFAEALRRSDRIAAIAEYKRRSPSAGPLRQYDDLADVVADYARAGASALSILTDRAFFGGSLDDLALARRATALPILRKDFLLDEEDILESRLAGADAVLLIARLLPSPRLEALLDEAERVGLSALVEVHSEAECVRAVAAGAKIIGVNHRDLDTLTIDLSLSERIAAHLPSGCVRVAESGLRTADDVRRMQERGFHAILVGEALLRSPAPGDTLAALLRGAACG